MLELKSVWSQYDEKVIVLRDISMKVPEGSATCVLGANGAGKTTLVKTIVNLVRPRKGEITFSGSRIERLKTQAGDLGGPRGPPAFSEADGGRNPADGSLLRK
jgi:ABC-type branched-subunit amino acid transport system ATPase component